MQLHDESEATTLHEYNEQTGYTGSSHYYEPFSGEPFQQRQAYYPPTSGYGPASYAHQPIAGTPPLSDSRFAAILSYSFGWLTGLLFTLFGGQNRFVRFHALQSLVFFGTINLIDVVLFRIMLSGLHHMIILLLICMLSFLLLNFIAFVSWIVAMVQAGRGVYFKLPFVGEWVERRFNLHATPLW
jgi:uncharacterized membrane protein